MQRSIFAHWSSSTKCINCLLEQPVTWRTPPAVSVATSGVGRTAHQRPKTFAWDDDGQQRTPCPPTVTGTATGPVLLPTDPISIARI